jgi:hypothetical protein
MVYDTQNYLLFWIFYILLYSKTLAKTTFRKLDLFPSAGKEKTPISPVIEVSSF